MIVVRNFLYWDFLLHNLTNRVHKCLALYTPSKRYCFVNGCIFWFFGESADIFWNLELLNFGHHGGYAECFLSAKKQPAPARHRNKLAVHVRLYSLAYRFSGCFITLSRVNTGFQRIRNVLTVLWVRVLTIIGLFESYHWWIERLVSVIRWI